MKVIKFPGPVKARLANAAKEFAIRTKDEEALEAATYLKPSPRVQIEQIPPEDERLQDFLVRTAAVRLTSRPKSVHQVVIYVAEGAPQDLWFGAYAMLAARTVRNIQMVEAWGPVIMPKRAIDLRELTGIAQFEALCFIQRMFADLDLVTLSDAINFSRALREKKRPLPRGEGARALEFLDWCLVDGVLPAPHEDFRIQAAELMRFFLAMTRCPTSSVDHIVSAISL